MAEYHATYGDDRDKWIGNHFTNRENLEKVIDIIYDYLDVLDEADKEGEQG